MLALPPQMDLAWGEGRITCMALEPSGERCWLGNGLGSIEVLDLAAKRFTGAVKGLAGARAYELACLLVCHVQCGSQRAYWRGIVLQ